MSTLTETKRDTGQTRPTDAVAVVTGAARGIGAASAQALADDGWAVAIVHRSGADEAGALAERITDGGGRATTIRADLRDTADFDGVFEQAEALGPVLGLVNNAGVRADNLALSISDDEWDLVIDTNLSAAFRLTRRAMRSMLRARFGRIVNVASVVGPRANPGQANYAASKAGLVGFARSLARELGSRGITVNVVAPGPVATDMTAVLGDKRLAELTAAVPLGRMAAPEEIAAAVAFLASDDAGYITGAVLPVDGGLGMGH